MLQNIKSSYFNAKIFSYIDERQKLKIIKCNKSLQKNINISIINYKFFTGKYIIYESNGFGKEYDGYNNRLMFEGEYLNGERNGKGKEYYGNDVIIFEGKYLNGKRNGYGKEYYNNGKLKFEGEYLNNEKWIGTGYDHYRNIIYELINGNGKVKEYNEYGIIFEGEYLMEKEMDMEKNIIEVVR